MLFADASPVIMISLEAAIAMATGIAGGLAASAKILVMFFKTMLDQVTKEVADNRQEIKENREAHALVTESLITLHKESINSNASFQVAMNKLIDQIDTKSNHGKIQPAT